MQKHRYRYLQSIDSVPVLVEVILKKHFDKHSFQKSKKLKRGSRILFTGKQS